MPVGQNNLLTLYILTDYMKNYKTFWIVRFSSAKVYVLFKVSDGAGAGHSRRVVVEGGTSRQQQWNIHLEMPAQLCLGQPTVPSLHSQLTAYLHVVPVLQGRTIQEYTTYGNQGI